jgi:flagellar biosynthesis GTPase FlhF
MRLVVVAMVGVVVVGISGCDKPRERTRDEAAIAAAIEQARREDAEADRQMRERAARQEQERRETEQAALDSSAAEQDARRAKQARFEQQVRATLIDPASLQIRNQRLTADGTALCAEVSAKNKQGVYGGFRRVIVTDSGVSFDRDPDDNDRRPEHRFAAISKATGCY